MGQGSAVQSMEDIIEEYHRVTKEMDALKLKHSSELVKQRLEGFISDPMLTPRECEIARLIAKGLPNKSIAAVLDISPWTVSTHLRRMFAKKKVRSRAALVAELMSQ